MKRIPVAGIIILAIVVAFSLIVGANTISDSLHQKDATGRDTTVSSPLGYMAITFSTFEGGGCGCVPLIDVPITAVGRTTDHITSNVTDDRGQCVVFLEYGETYRITMVPNGYRSSMFDFNVLDDQSFVFHLDIINDSSVPHNLFRSYILEKMPLMNKLVTKRLSHD
jgi:hypothetical protein